MSHDLSSYLFEPPTNVRIPDLKCCHQIPNFLHLSSTFAICPQLLSNDPNCSHPPPTVCLLTPNVATGSKLLPDFQLLPSVPSCCLLIQTAAICPWLLKPDPNHCQLSLISTTWPLLLPRVPNCCYLIPNCCPRLLPPDSQLLPPDPQLLPPVPDCCHFIPNCPWKPFVGWADINCGRSFLPLASQLILSRRTDYSTLGCFTYLIQGVLPLKSRMFYLSHLLNFLLISCRMFYKNPTGKFFSSWKIFQWKFDFLQKETLYICLYPVRDAYLICYTVCDIYCSVRWNIFLSARRLSVRRL